MIDHGDVKVGSWKMGSTLQRTSWLLQTSRSLERYVDLPASPQFDVSAALLAYNTYSDCRFDFRPSQEKQ